MKNLFQKYENIFIISLVLLSMILTLVRDNGVYLFLGILYSIIIYLIFLFARRKNSELNKKQFIKLGLMSIFIIVIISVALILLVIFGLLSFMEALQNVG